MGDEVFKVSQFADDTSFTLTDNSNNITEIFQNLKKVPISIGDQG